MSRVRERTEVLTVDGDDPGTDKRPQVRMACQWSPIDTPLEVVIDQITPLPSQVGVRVRRVTRMSDVVTPNYHRKLREGAILATNPMTKTVTEIPEEPLVSHCLAILYNSIHCDDTWTPGPRWHVTVRRTNVVLTQPNASFSLHSRAELNELAIQAQAKLYKQGLDYLTTASESRKTIAMLLNVKRNLLRNVNKLANALRRDYRNGKLVSGALRNPGSTLRALDKVLQDYWLEMRYGWRILYFDLMNIENYLNNMSEESKLIYGRSSSTKESSETIGGLERVRTETVRFGFAGLTRPWLPGHSSLANTAWDLTPFSFVVDWFFNIQDRVLLMSGSPDNVELLPNSSYRVIERSAVHTAQAPEPPPIPNFTMEVIHQSTPVSLRAESVERIVPSSPNILSWPSFAGGPEGYQRLDLLALLRPMRAALRRN